MAIVKSLHHLAVHVHYFDKTLWFYGEVLGLQQVSSWNEKPNRAAMFDTGNCTKLEFFETDNEIFKEGQIPHFAFHVDDCDEVFAKVVEAGALVKMEPQDVDISGNPGIKARIAFIYGPSGEVIELFQEN